MANFVCYRSLHIRYTSVAIAVSFVDVDGVAQQATAAHQISRDVTCALYVYGSFLTRRNIFIPRHIADKMRALTLRRKAHGRSFTVSGKTTGQRGLTHATDDLAVSIVCAVTIFFDLNAATFNEMFQRLVPIATT